MASAPDGGAFGDPAQLAAWIHDVVLAEAEARVLAVLAEAGFPTDLTRAPTPAEVASRTQYTAIEADTESATVAVLAALVAARAAIIANLEAVLAGALTVVEVLRRLDLTVAGVLALPGALDVVTDLQAALRRLLAAAARRAAMRLVADAHRARIRVTDSRTLDDLLDVDGSHATPTSPVAGVLEVQATRLAAETTDRTVREVRDVAHRVAAATGAAAGPPRPAAPVSGPVVAAPAPAEVTAAFTDAVPADARQAGPSRTVRDSAHQGVLAAAGAGRVAAAAAYRRPTETASAEAPADPPADGTPRSSGLDPTDPDRDSARPDAGTPGGAGDDFVPEDGARFYASELLDRNTCTPCSEVDGREYDTWAAAVADYPLGQYRLCEGGSRCRGTLVMVSAREDPATLQTPYGR